MDGIDVLAQLFLAVRVTDETVGQLGQGEFLAQVCGQEEHEPQSAVHLGPGLEGGCAGSAGVPKVGIVVAEVTGEMLDAGSCNLRGDDRCRAGALRLVSKLEVGGCIQASTEGIRSLLRADDGGIRVLQDEHGQIVRVGICHVQVLPVHVHRGGEATGIDDLDQVVGNALSTQPRGYGVQTQARDGHLRHSGRGARDRSGRLLAGLLGHGD